MRVLCAFLILALTTGVAGAKCADRLIHVFGKVEEAPGVPASGVPVGVSWLERGRASGPAMALTASDGSFSVRFRFNRYSGSWLLGGDRCNGELLTILVAAYGPEARSWPVEVAVGESDELDAGVIGLNARLEHRPEEVPPCGS